VPAAAPGPVQLIADKGNNRVRVVAARTGTFYGQAMTAGDIYTIAGRGDLGLTGDGGPATSARLGFPEAVVVDPAGNVFIARASTSRPRTHGQVWLFGLATGVITGDAPEEASGSGRRGSLPRRPSHFVIPRHRTPFDASQADQAMLSGSAARITRST
jgi:hypothetical protein